MSLCYLFTLPIPYYTFSLSGTGKSKVYFSLTWWIRVQVKAIPNYPLSYTIIIQHKNYKILYIDVYLYGGDDWYDLLLFMAHIYLFNDTQIYSFIRSTPYSIKRVFTCNFFLHFAYRTWVRLNFCFWFTLWVRVWKYSHQRKG